MIKSNITVEVNSTELDGVLIVPSAVFTSTVQEEELDLTKTPNFQIVVGKGGEINDTVEVSFTAEEVEYTANMKVVNRNGSAVTLQYVDGLTAEEAPEPEKSEAPIITYDDSNFTVSASGQGTVKMYVDGVETVSPHTFTQGESDVTYVVTATAQQDGKEISDTVTENCLVPAASEPEEQHTYTVVGNAPICGSNWDLNITDNDMVNEGNNLYSWSREGVQITDPSQTKIAIVQDRSWSTRWPAQEYNLKLSVGVYNIEIQFNADTKEITPTVTSV